MNPQTEAGFDRAIQQRHADAVAKLSPRVQAQLAQRRNAALRGDVPARATGFRLRHAGAAFAAVFALAIGMQLHNPSPVVTPPAGSTPLAVQDAGTLLDEDPEFYAWLASPDAQLVAME
ncbi:MAG: hypothetical protein QM612_10975 [Thermomonas sp.]|uniref:hypothetical protein n=1 Tax=Thermomonas sp. TaxID=1971895 RepID=UPI0039E5476C